MNAVRRAAGRLCAGSAALCRAYAVWLAPGDFRAFGGRLAGSLAALFLLGGIVLAAPQLMWPATVAWCVAAWRAGGVPAEQADDEPEGLGVLEVVQALHAVADPHVHLVPLAERLGTTTVRVRELLAEAGLPVAAGVRMRGRGVSPGVRAGDIPPLPSPTSGEQEGDVAAGQASNNNSNSVVVERIAEGVAVVRYPAETAARRHTITTR